MGRLGQIIAATSSPDEDIIRQMLDHGVGSLLRRSQAAANESDVFMIPSVAVCNRSAIADPSDLVAIIPPSQYSRISWGLVSQPPVGFTIVIHHDLSAIPQGRLKHDRWMRKAHRHLRSGVVEIDGMVMMLVEKKDTSNSSSFSKQSNQEKRPNFHANTFNGTNNTLRLITFHRFGGFLGIFGVTLASWSRGREGIFLGLLALFNGRGCIVDSLRFHHFLLVFHLLLHRSGFHLFGIRKEESEEHVQQVIYFTHHKVKNNTES
mmetsp:Transcript_7884/g.14859  ORF Transcript_7884/g.14859 Transcript_7884/m.14859 type:complete len:263 (-) Transcript_7884:518-1306(-)